jgi:uncharacterized Zn-finger protein
MVHAIKDNENESIEKIVKLEVRCPRCREMWSLNPNMWRNLNSIIDTGKKTIICPYCGRKGKLDPEQTIQLLKSRGIYFDRRMRELDGEISRAKSKVRNIHHR